MQTIGANNYNSSNHFGFSFQTSSGDIIDLSLYDERSLSISQEQSDTTKTTTLSLSHAYGYQFHYKGNGIDANDQKEIDAAMKTIQPKLDEYFKSVQSASSEDATTTNTAFDINTLLPKTKDLNTQNYLNDSLLKSLDTLLAKSQDQSEKMLQKAQKLFDRILKQCGYV